MENYNELVGKITNKRNQCEIERTEEWLNKLRKESENGKLTLCLGAGTTSTLIGEWKELLNEIAVMRCCELSNKAGSPVDMNDLLAFIEKYADKGRFLPSETNGLEQGEYLMLDELDITADEKSSQERRLWSESFFAAQTLQAIERLKRRKMGNSQFSAGVTKSVPGKVTMEEIIITYAKVWIENEAKSKATKSAVNPIKGPQIATLIAVVRLCIKRNISEVITFNFDTVLDTLLGNSEIWKSIDSTMEQRPLEIYGLYGRVDIDGLGEKNSKSDSPIRIYHVHGVVDQRITSVQPIIFSENSYEDYQDRVLNWSNVRIADAMHQSTLLTIGFSGDDPNFRKLCRIFSNQQTNSSIMNWKGTDSLIPRVFLTRSLEGAVRQFLPHSEITTFTLNRKEKAMAKLCFETYLDSVTNYFKYQLNVQILWFLDYDNMAEKLSAMTDK